MIFQSLGGGECIGGSCYKYHLRGKTLITDCGIAFGKQNKTLYPHYINKLSDQYIDAVLVTHAHHDHIGALTLLARAHPETIIYATEMTKALTEIMLRDALRFAVINEKETFLTERAIGNLLARIRVANFGDWFSPWKGWEICLWPAGHIPGAASILIKVGNERVLHSGDISFYGDAAIDGAQIPDGFYPKTIVTAATCCQYELPDRKSEEKRLCDLVKCINERGGHVLIPAAAVGRGPQVAAMLAKAGFEVSLGGLAMETFKAYGLPENRITFIGKERDEHWLDTRIRIAESAKPLVVVATSAMVDGGISRDLAAAWIENPKNGILIPGFQAEETTGAKLKTYKKGDIITFPAMPNRNSMALKVRADVEEFALSGHAGGSQLAEWIKALSPKKVILVHGTMPSFVSIKQRLKEDGFTGQVEIGYNNRKLFC